MNKIKIVINPKYADSLTGFVESILDNFDNSGRIDYQGRNTIKVFEENGFEINVKSFKKPILLNQFIYCNIRDSKAKRSYNYARKLIERGINTPDPIAYLEETSCRMLQSSAYICIHNHFDGYMRELQQGEFSEKRELLDAFAKFTAELHEKEILHLDYSSGNILYKKSGDSYTFYLVDLNRMVFDKPVDMDTACFNFRRLWGSDEMIAFFVRKYAQYRNLDEELCLERAFEYRSKFWKFFWKKHPEVKPYIESAEKRTLRIGFDAKRATQNFTGLGNYSRFVINNLIKYYPNNTYELFSPRVMLDKPEIVISPNIKFITKTDGPSKSKPFWRSFGIKKDIRRERVQIYHGLSNELPFGIRKTGAKSIVTIHDLIFLRYPEFYKFVDRTIYRIKAKYACKAADRIIAVSECTKRDIVSFFKINPDKIDVVYQGCSHVFKEQVNDERKKEVSEKYGLPPKFILSIGSIEERKNILLIVKALKQLPDVHFVAIGKFRRYADLVKEYVKEHGLEDRVHMKTNIPLEDLPAILQQSDVFIYPSIYEGFGIPIIEALSSGIPVIGAMGSCLEEAGGPDTIYVDPYDENELASQINKVLSDSELRDKMISEGLKYVDRFSSDKCSANLMNIYNKIV